MNTTTRTRLAGASVLLAVLVGTAACGNETVAEPGTTGYEARIDPPVSVPSAPLGKPGRVSADSAERQAKADKERQDRASAQRWDRGSQIENKLERAGLPGRP
jgi:hypothetical protein